METTNKVVYDPKQAYKWEPDDEFVFTGQEFGYIYNSLMKDKAELLRKLEVLKVLEAKLIHYVETGIIQVDSGSE